MFKEHNLPYVLLIARGRIAGFIPLPKASALYEMKTASFKIRTQVAESISNDDNCYGTSWWWRPRKNISWSSWRDISSLLYCSYSGSESDNDLIWAVFGYESSESAKRDTSSEYFRPCTSYVAADEIFLL